MTNQWTDSLEFNYMHRIYLHMRQAFLVHAWVLQGYQLSVFLS